MQNYLPLLLILAVIAVLLRDETILTLFYLLAGVYFLGWGWQSRALRALRAVRQLPAHAFPGETVPVQLELANSGLLPLPWLHLQESLPPGLGASGPFLQVLSLGPRAVRRLGYSLQTFKRGYYSVGPLFLSSGDLYGLQPEHRWQVDAQYLTVYPRIVPLTRLDLPSQAPLGTLRHPRPLSEDPTRVVGKRDYQSGDSLRRVDWKATAAIGRLQVKQLEPSIALEVVLALNLRAADYPLAGRYDASELAVTTAASFAHWLAEHKQPVGLLLNAGDAAGGDSPALVPARRGRGHLVRLLEGLARAELREDLPALPDVLRRETVHLAWGTTLVVITGTADEALLDTLLAARRAGQQTMLILASPTADLAGTRSRLARFGVPVHQVARERDLDVWRG